MSSVYKTEIVHCTLLLSYFSLIFATQAGERNSESVEVTFYQLSDSEWNSSQSSFKTLVATEASSYCASYSDCGLSSGFIFTAHEVGVSSGPTADSKSLKISFYIDFPVVHTVSGSSSTTYVVSSAVTAKILANVRTAAESVVGHDITYIGTEFYSIDPDAFLNKIIIPVACVVLLLVVVLAVGLHLWSKSKAKEAVKRQRSVEKERRKKSSRVTPTHSVAREGKEYNPLFASGPVAPNPTLPGSEQTTPTNNNRLPLRHNALPPLLSTPTKKTNDSDDGARKEKKEERKRRKQEKRQQQQQQQQT
ncbi:uncharacterized protein LOC143277007 isoform X2 [Babylonia areolata]|uniref:uncharacterized protein LOC143277007 isoform X2 n=1 Tax=Babylonia areolata TaxID=304850 RepID=UPI003FD0B0ED